VKLIPLSLYAFAESGIFAVEFFVRLQLLIFYTDRLKIDSYLASIAAGLALVWDAFIDPFIGSFSDRFQSRWGNRIPFMVAGALLIVPSLVWIFSPFWVENRVVLFAQLLVASLLLNTGITLVTVPHAAISAELTRDPKGRTRVYAVRLLFANLGLIIGLIVPALGMREAGSALAIASFSLVAVFVCVISLKPNRNEPLPAAALRNLQSDLRAAVKNRYFVWLFIAGFLAYIGVAVNSTIARYYYDHFLRVDEKALAVVLIIFILVWSLSAVLWVVIADRFGKDLPATLGVVALGLMTIFSYPMFPEKDITGPIVAAILGGFFTGSILLFDSFVADAADLDHARTGENREGFYFGLWKFGIKASRGVAVVAAGVLLTAIGYEAGTPPADQVRFRIALIFGPLVGTIFVLSGVVYYFFAARIRKMA